MRVSEALGESKPLEVKFGTAVLNITYRTPSFTVEELEAAQADQVNPNRLIKMIQDLVLSWDLEDDTGEPIPMDDATAIKKHVPISVYNKIIVAIREDNSPGEA